MGIPIRKQVLEKLLPQEYHHILKQRKEFHITLKFRDFDPSIIGKLHEIKLVGVYKDNGGNSALVVSVDGKILREDGNIFHITTSVVKPTTPKDLGPLSAAAFKSKASTFTSVEFTPGSPMLDKEGNFHALSWFLSKKSIPMHVGLDIDGTTFLCDTDFPDSFEKFNSPDFTKQHLKGNWPLYLLRQIPSECIRFITNRRAPEDVEGMIHTFSKIASKYLGTPITVEIDWEPEDWTEVKRSDWRRKLIPR